MKTKSKKRRQLASNAGSKKTEIISHFPAVDSRPILITGTLDGKEVAWDRADTNRLADRVATSWRESGLEVVVT